jgi:Mg-chelatase subunit ChlD
MNPDSPKTPREELEARVTALLLGQLSADEAEALRQIIAQDPELARLHRRLKLAVELARETAKSPQADLVKPDTLKLAPERRAALLASFAAPQPIKVAWHSRVPRRELLAMAAMIVALLAVGGIVTMNLDGPFNPFLKRREGVLYSDRREYQPEFARGVRVQGGAAPSAESALSFSKEPLESREKAAEQATERSIPQLMAPASKPASGPGAAPQLPPAAADASRFRRGTEDTPASNPETLARQAGATVELKGSKDDSTYKDGFDPRSASTSLGLPQSTVTVNDAESATRDLQRNSGRIILPVPGELAPGEGVSSGGGGAGGRQSSVTEFFSKSKLQLPNNPAPNASGSGRGIHASGPAPQKQTDLGSLAGLQDSTKKEFYDSISERSQSQDWFGANAKETDEKKNRQPFGNSATPEPSSRKLSGGGVGGAAAPSRDEALRFVEPSTGLSTNGVYSIAGVGFAQNGRSDVNGNMVGDSLSIIPGGASQKVLTTEGSLRAYNEAAPVPNAAPVAPPIVAEPTPATEAERLGGATPSPRGALGRTLAEKKDLDADATELTARFDVSGPSSINTDKPTATAPAPSKRRLEIALPQQREQEKREGQVAANRPAPADALAEDRQGIRGEDLVKLFESGGKTIAKTDDKPASGSEPKLTKHIQDVEEQLETPSQGRKLEPAAGIPQPEIASVENAFSTFSLNVSDVSFKLAAASLEKGVMPDPATVRTEEFINAFDYRDPEPAGSAPIAFAFERARHPFAHDRDLVRLSVKTAASGRQPGRPLNLVLLLDNSGSMERADRLRIRQECLRVLASQLQPQDRISVVSFARTARLSVDGLSGSQAGELPQRVGELTPEGGTNLEEAMNLAYQTALRHYLASGVNRVVLLTDGAANLGDVTPESLKKKVETNRQQGIALDCFGIGWEGYNDDLLEVLSRNGDGRYGFVNTPEAAATEFAGQLAGALKVAASDVKVQVEFNPRRATAYRQLGYAKHQLKKEQFRDNTVDAAEIGAAEAGNALYVVQVNPRGEGPVATVRVRFKVPGTNDYREHEWPVPYDGAAKTLEQSPASMRLAATAAAFSEWLVSSPYAAEVTPDRLLSYLSGVPESSPADPRPKKLEWMIRQARSVAGK